MKKRKGFTIIEILIVIMILGVLYTIAALYTAGMQDEAKIAKVKGDLKTLELALNGYLKNFKVCTPEENYQTTLLLSNSNILTKNVMDPFGATTNTLYAYTISDNQRYYAVYSVGPSKNGSTTIGDSGYIEIEGSPIYETNGYE